MTSNEANAWIHFNIITTDSNGCDGGSGIELELESNEHEFCRNKLEIVQTNEIREASKVTLKTLQEQKFKFDRMLKRDCNRDLRKASIRKLW